jgi:DNA-binding NarL/FixJ family response regulator
MENIGSVKSDPIRLWVIAPSLALRTGLRAMLASDERLVVSGESPGLSGQGKAVNGCDVIVIDESGLDDNLLEEAGASRLSPLREALEGGLLGGEVVPALLLLSDDPEHLGELIDLPLRAWGVIPLDSSAEEMISAIQALHEGLIVAAPHLLKTWLQVEKTKAEGPFHAALDFDSTAIQSGNLRSLDEARASAFPLVTALTPRETEVLQLLAQGLANKQMALALGISEHTIKFHVSSIYAKLGVGNRTEAVRVGVRQGLILL